MAHRMHEMRSMGDPLLQHSYDSVDADKEHRERREQQRLTAGHSSRRGQSRRERSVRMSKRLTSRGMAMPRTLQTMETTRDLFADLQAEEGLKKEVAPGLAAADEAEPLTTEGENDDTAQFSLMDSLSQLRMVWRDLYRGLTLKLASVLLSDVLKDDVALSTLKFHDQETEEAYRDYVYERTRFYYRYLIVFGVMAFIFYSFGDLEFPEPTRTYLIVIRFGLVIPAVSIVLLLTFFKRIFFKYYLLIVNLLIFWIAFHTNTMAALRGEFQSPTIPYWLATWATVLGSQATMRWLRWTIPLTFLANRLVMLVVWQLYGGFDWRQWLLVGALQLMNHGSGVGVAFVMELQFRKEFVAVVQSQSVAETVYATQVTYARSCFGNDVVDYAAKLQGKAVRVNTAVMVFRIHSSTPGNMDDVRASLYRCCDAMQLQCWALYGQDVFAVANLHDIVIHFAQRTDSIFLTRLCALAHDLQHVQGAHISCAIAVDGLLHVSTASDEYAGLCISGPVLDAATQTVLGMSHGHTKLVACSSHAKHTVNAVQTQEETGDAPGVVQEVRPDTGRPRADSVAARHTLATWRLTLTEDMSLEKRDSLESAERRVQERVEAAARKGKYGAFEPKPQEETVVDGEAEDVDGDRVYSYDVQSHVHERASQPQHPLWLTFLHPRLDKQFRLWEAKSNHGFVQLMLLSFMFLHCALAIQDLLLARFAVRELFTVRLGIGLPVFTIAFAFTASGKIFERRMQTVMTLVGMLMLPTVAVLEQIVQGTPNQTSYRLVALRSILHLHVSFFLHHRNAVFVNLFMIAVYAVVQGVVVQAAFSRFIAALLVLWALGSVASRIVEQSRRNIFLLRRMFERLLQEQYTLEASMQAVAEEAQGLGFVGENATACFCMLVKVEVDSEDAYERYNASCRMMEVARRCASTQLLFVLNSNRSFFVVSPPQDLDTEANTNIARSMVRMVSNVMAKDVAALPQLAYRAGMSVGQVQFHVENSQGTVTMQTLSGMAVVEAARVALEAAPMGIAMTDEVRASMVTPASSMGKDARMSMQLELVRNQRSLTLRERLESVSRANSGPAKRSGKMLSEDGLEDEEQEEQSNKMQSLSSKRRSMAVDFFSVNALNDDSKTKRLEQVLRASDNLSHNTNKWLVFKDPSQERAFESYHAHKHLRTQRRGIVLWMVSILVYCILPTAMYPTMVNYVRDVWLLRGGLGMFTGCLLLGLLFTVWGQQNSQYIIATAFAAAMMHAILNDILDLVYFREWSGLLPVQLQLFFGAHFLLGIRIQVLLLCDAFVLGLVVTNVSYAANDLGLPAVYPTVSSVMMAVSVLLAIGLAYLSEAQYRRGFLTHRIFVQLLGYSTDEDKWWKVPSEVHATYPRTKWLSEFRERSAERDYLRSLGSQTTSLRTLRLVVYVCSSVLLLFAIVDVRVFDTNSELFLQVVLLRFLVTIPLFMVAFGLTYTPVVRKHMQLVVFVFSVVLMALVFVLSAMAPTSAGRLVRYDTAFAMVSCLVLSSGLITTRSSVILSLVLIAVSLVFDLVVGTVSSFTTSYVILMSVTGTVVVIKHQILSRNTFAMRKMCEMFLANQHSNPGSQRSERDASLLLSGGLHADSSLSLASSLGRRPSQYVPPSFRSSLHHQLSEQDLASRSRENTT